MQKIIPILYSTLMVQALIAGTKTKTRRTKGLEKFNTNPDAFTNNGRRKDLCRFYKEGTPDPNPLETYHILESADGFFNEVKCPYGKVGDIHWVRECVSKTIFDGCYIYKAETDPDLDISWKPSIHMPKVACRLWNEISNVKIERLHDISEQDAIEEGVKFIDDLPYGAGFNDYLSTSKIFYPKASTSFFSLWKKINGKESFELNPWVWVISFKRIQKPENFIS